jgi:hypothetical protein
MLLPCAFFVHFTIDCFTRRAAKMHAAAMAVHALVEDPRIQNRALCFLSYPAEVLGDQPAEVCWVIRNDHTIPVYCDPATALVQADAHTVQSTRWRNVASNYHDQNYVTITPVHNGFRYTSSNPDKVNFCIRSPGDFPLGPKIIHRTQTVNGVSVVTDFTLVIDTCYREKNPVSVVWDYAKKRFIIF